MEEIEGYVVEEVVEDKEVQSFIKDKKVARMTKTKEGVRIRYISEDNKGNVHADLEDLYLYYNK